MNLNIDITNANENITIRTIRHFEELAQYAEFGDGMAPGRFDEDGYLIAMICMQIHKALTGSDMYAIQAATNMIAVIYDEIHLAPGDALAIDAAKEAIHYCKTNARKIKAMQGIGSHDRKIAFETTRMIRAAYRDLEAVAEEVSA